MKASTLILRKVSADAWTPCAPSLDLWKPHSRVQHLGPALGGSVAVTGAGGGRPPGQRRALWTGSEEREEEPGTEGQRRDRARKRGEELHAEELRSRDWGSHRSGGLSRQGGPAQPGAIEELLADVWIGGHPGVGLRSQGAEESGAQGPGS
ncbi:hypothetical protein NDU88_000491 [Pleurodeles waltl]|uniref:Uncharacterized protein n=1 Tax=Pleurodeles waltl TaxID=8319 RepID=A0AAV7TG10_PLEWA|nr:hypothetical protein NDU88_000491 [Pleurodeles waltl]